MHIHKEGKNEFILLKSAFDIDDIEYFIRPWINNKDTVEFLTLWEISRNPDFIINNVYDIQEQVGLNTYNLTVDKWAETTNGIGVQPFKNKSGSDVMMSVEIALDFLSWLSPNVKFFMLDEYKKLKRKDSSDYILSLIRNLDLLNMPETRK